MFLYVLLTYGHIYPHLHPQKREMGKVCATKTKTLATSKNNSLPTPPSFGSVTRCEIILAHAHTHPVAGTPHRLHINRVTVKGPSAGNSFYNDADRPLDDTLGYICSQRNIFFTAFHLHSKLDND